MVKLKQSFVLAGALAFSLIASAAYAQSDAALTASVKTRLAADDLVKATAINVDTADHVVTLKGTVASLAGKSRAEQIAKSTKGVTRVINLLTVTAK